MLGTGSRSYFCFYKVIVYLGLCMCDYIYLWYESMRIVLCVTGYTKSAQIILPLENYTTYVKRNKVFMHSLSEIKTAEHWPPFSRIVMQLMLT